MPPFWAIRTYTWKQAPAFKVELCHKFQGILRSDSWTWLRVPHSACRLIVIELQTIVGPEGGEVHASETLFIL